MGRLFWSHGIDCVRGGNSTPITGRERYFRSLPGQDSLFAQFYGTANWAPVGYYKDHSPYKTYDIGRANLLRKYGEDFDQAFADVTHRRFESWGINTIANWSDEQVYLMRRTPYVGTISFEAKKLEGSEGYWGKFYDVFDPSFEEKTARAARTRKGTDGERPVVHRLLRPQRAVLGRRHFAGGSGARFAAGPARQEGVHRRPEGEVRRHREAQRRVGDHSCILGGPAAEPAGPG